MKCITPTSVEGSVVALPSKSVLQRAVIIAALADGSSVLRAAELCDDAKAALRVARVLGAEVRVTKNAVEVIGRRRSAGGVVDCGESALALRMGAAVAALLDADTTFGAAKTLARRSVRMIPGPLRSLGARCATNDGTPPVTVRGPIRGGAVEVDATESSQFLSGLLAALPMCEEDSVITAPGARSKPYVALTLKTLERHGIEIGRDPGLERFFVPGGQAPSPASYSIEGDWSAAAFHLVAGAIAGEVEVTGLDMFSAQADRAILEGLAAAGARYETWPGAVRVWRGDLRGFEFDATHCPDLFLPLAALAVCCEGRSALRGVHRLAKKESDRAATLSEGFRAMGCALEKSGDLLLIEGRRPTGGVVDAAGDHRIAMAASIAALRAKGPVGIAGSRCVSKSYPGFFDDLARLQGKRA